MNNYQEDRYNKINKIYDKLTYFDKYGGSVFFLIIISIILGLGIAYCVIQINIQTISKNWIIERCKPYILPFAGIINKPSNMSIIDYTNQNFQYCMQNVIKDVSSDAVQPLTFVVSFLNFIANAIKDSINAIRNMFNKVRTELQSVTEEIMGRLGNIMVPLQQIIISMRDMMSKIQGVMTASLFTLLGGYYALQALMGAIAQFIIIILISLAAMIALFWILPFTWGIAASTTAIFISIAVPLVIILVFMLEYLHIKPSLGIPTIQCFDENTKIPLKNGTWKEIKNIEIGDILLEDEIFNNSNNSNFVTSIFKVNANFSQMYQLNNIIVSDSHLVFYQNNWIRVKNHPEAEKITYYEKPILYCLNTSNQIIKIKDTLFSDWNEEILIKKIDFKLKIGGFYPDTQIVLENGYKKSIKNIEINDILENGEKVTGLVEIDGTKIENHSLLCLGMNEEIKVAGLLNYKKNNSKKNSYFKPKNETKIFHLLTDKNQFQIKNIIFNDYNSYIDSFLQNTNKNRI